MYNRNAHIFSRSSRNRCEKTAFEPTKIKKSNRTAKSCFFIVSGGICELAHRDPARRNKNRFLETVRFSNLCHPHLRSLAARRVIQPPCPALSHTLPCSQAPPSISPNTPKKTAASITPTAANTKPNLYLYLYSKFSPLTNVFKFSISAASGCPRWSIVNCPRQWNSRLSTWMPLASSNFFTCP